MKQKQESVMTINNNKLTQDDVNGLNTIVLLNIIKKLKDNNLLSKLDIEDLFSNSVHQLKSVGDGYNGAIDYIEDNYLRD